MRNKMIMIAALLAVMAAMTGIAAADNNLWVVPENPTKWIGVISEDATNSETVVEEVNMGTEFSGNIIILYQTPPIKDDPEPSGVSIHFFVADASKINNIDIGKAKRVTDPDGSPTISDNTGAAPAATGLTFSSVLSNPPVPEGFGVSYLVGNIPYSGGPSVTGDPEPNVDGFHPERADAYVKVPFTIRFNSPPEPGFLLYTYADGAGTKTVWSHDGGFYQVPEFSTVAIPIAAVLGLVFFFQRRKKKEE